MLNNRTFKRFKKSRASLAGLGIIFSFLLLALLAPYIARPSGPDAYQMPQAGYSPEPSAPSRTHILGTTEQQYDLFYGVIWGTRTAFKIGAAVVLVSLLFGMAVGGLAGYYGGWADETAMRLTDVVLAFPGIVLAVVIVAMLGPGVEKVVLAIAAVSWPAYARLFRGDILTVKRLDFVTASRVMGAGDHH